MKKALVCIVLLLFAFPLSVNAESKTYDEVVDKIESINLHGNQYTEFVYIVELSNVVLENKDNLNEEELEKVEALMMTYIHRRMEPLYEAHFSAINSTNGSYLDWFNGSTSGINPFEVLRSNLMTQSTIQSQTGE